MFRTAKQNQSDDNDWGVLKFWQEIVSVSLFARAIATLSQWEVTTRMTARTRPLTLAAGINATNQSASNVFLWILGDLRKGTLGGQLRHSVIEQGQKLSHSPHSIQNHYGGGLIHP